MFGEDGLDVLREDVLAAGEDDHVLEAALDAEESLVVEVAKVTGPVPVAVEGRGGLFGGAPVARGDVVAAHEDFACVADLDFDVGKRATGRIDSPFVYCVVANDGGGFGGAVALHDLDSEQLPFSTEIRD